MRFIAVVTCATLFVGVGSINPAGTVTVAWLTCVPTPPAVARSWITTLAPTGKVRVPLNCVDATTEAVNVPPPLPLDASNSMPKRPLGSVSLTVAAVAAFGPALDTVSVNTVVWASRITVGDADLVMPRSACGPMFTVAVPALLLVSVSVVPVGAAMVVTRLVRVLAPATLAETKVSVPMLAGRVSTTLAPVTALGPRLT